MEFKIEGSGIYFEIEVDRNTRLIELTGGEWRLKVGDGSPGVFLADRRVPLSKVIARAFSALAEPSYDDAQGPKLSRAI